MRNEQNIADLEQLGVDMMGFICYPPSPRYVGETSLPSTSTARVGVFVNESLSKIEIYATKHALTHIQLHGNESTELCHHLKSKGYAVIKSISIEDKEDFENTIQYDGIVDLFLFDTKCHAYGGSGKTFDWSLLQSYKGSTPFLLSGGIDENMSEGILSISHPQFAGIDINSRFETEPALKDIAKIKTFIRKIR